MKPYSLDLRQKVVQAYKQGNDSYRQLAKRFQVTGTTPLLHYA